MGSDAEALTREDRQRKVRAEGRTGEGVVAAPASFFVLKQLLEIFDKADGNNNYRTSHTEEEERHDYVCHKTNDEIHRRSIVPPNRACP